MVLSRLSEVSNSPGLQLPLGTKVQGWRETQKTGGSKLVFWSPCSVAIDLTRARGFEISEKKVQN